MVELWPLSCAAFFVKRGKSCNARCIAARQGIRGEWTADWRGYHEESHGLFVGESSRGSRGEYPGRLRGRGKKGFEDP